MKIENVKIKELIEADYNPRSATSDEEENLKKSIERFGLVEPIIVNSNEKRKNIIIGGHFRYRMAKKMGYKEMPVHYIDIADIEKEKELNLRLNKNLGHWDQDKLAEMTREVLDKVGFMREELDDIFGKMRKELLPTEKKILDKPYKKIHFLFSISVDEYKKYENLITKLIDTGIEYEQSSN